jgi:SP family arabinose:H+ symporter-like MFS transporter
MIVSLGGFLMGFDASVISGVVGFIELEFSLTRIELGWSVASLTLAATLAMLLAGPLSDRLGRRPVLRIAAALFAVSAIASALAPGFLFLIIARMIGGLGVGAALVIAPVYIAEISPASLRGRMVSINQLNIVLGISVAFFSNYLVLALGQSGLVWTSLLGLDDWGWRWMLGIETLPAVLYFLGLSLVPESPRWLAMHGREQEARQILERAAGAQQAQADLEELRNSLGKQAGQVRATVGLLFAPAMKLVLGIAVSVAILQQITGINSVFFYAPMIFEQSGIGTDAAFMQAVLVGLVNLLFTLVAMAVIDRLGRRPLLGLGLAGITICMFTLSCGFGSARYSLSREAIQILSPQVHGDGLALLAGHTYDSDLAFKKAASAALGKEAFKRNEAQILRAAIVMNPLLILFGILGFVASFAVSLGPVMWVLFSELFPNQLRGVAVSFAGLINSAVSFGVQLVFPWELENLGNSMTFLIYGLFALVGFFLVMRILPETKGRTLEELQHLLVRG